MNDPHLAPYEPLTLIRENKRYATYRGELHGQSVFIKAARQAELQPRLITEASGLLNLAQLDLHEQYYTVPQVIRVEENALITSWSEGVLMKDEFELGHPQFENHLSTLLNLFLYFDAQSSPTGEGNRYTVPGRENAVDSVLFKLRGHGFAEHIDAPLLESLADLVRPRLVGLDKRFAHGDLQPGNILIGGKVPILIDGEACSWLWPRHYNAINFVVNYTHLSEQLEQRLNQFLTDYFAQLGLDLEAVREHINTIAGVRCLQMAWEELGGYLEDRPMPHIRPEIKDYVERTAQTILSERIFNDRLSN